MNGDTAGLESTDASSQSDLERERAKAERRSLRRSAERHEEAAKVFQDCVWRAEEIGEFKLAREAQDALQRATGEGERCRKALHGEDTEDAQVDAFRDVAGTKEQLPQ